MGSIARTAATAVMLGLLVVACGGADGGTAGPTATVDATASTEVPPTADITPPEGLDIPGGPTLPEDVVTAEDVAAAIGESPEPQCGEVALTATATCRWTASDGTTILQVEIGTEYDALADWRDAFALAGFDEDVPGIGQAALAGDNPFGGVRASAFADDATTVTVVLTKDGERGALLEIVTGLLGSIVEQV